MTAGSLQPQRGDRVVAPAKLTVSLRVLGRRSDGYHELEAEMVAVDLYDELWIDPAGDGLTVAAAAGSRAEALDRGQGNLVRRALVAAGRTAAVHLDKRIPLGGGLGGGSSDAGAVLRWAGCTDPAIAVRVGADVPFCVAGGRALVTGIGERLTPLPYVARSFVLLVPPFGVDTAACYRAWDELSGAGTGGGGDGGPNDLTAAALTTEPRLAGWRDALQSLTGREPVLAGSGSTWFVEWTDGPAPPGPEAVRLGRDEGRLIPVRTVPAGWSGPPAVTRGPP